MIRIKPQNPEWRRDLALHLIKRRRPLTQEKLAARCGLSRKYIADIERRKSLGVVSADTLIALAKATNTPLLE